MEIFNLKTKNIDQLIDSTLTYWDNGNTIKLDYNNDYISLTAEDKFPFFALAKIRLELEKLNMFILCNGSRMNVYPSGISAMGLKAYELYMNKQATILVNIFEAFNDVDQIVTVNVQKEFRNNWLNSLGK